MSYTHPFIPEPWPPVLTIDEVAAILRRSKKTVLRWVDLGLIRFSQYAPIGPVFG